MRKHIISSGYSLVLAIITQLLLAPLPCRAGSLLPLTLDPTSPVVLGINGTLSYDANTGLIHSTMDALTYNSSALPDGFAFFSGTAQATIDFYVNQAGTFDHNGAGTRLTGQLDLDGDGKIDVSSDASNPLLHGTVTAFGADVAGPPTRAFDGYFQIQGGELTQTIALSGGGTLFGGFPITGATGAFILFGENVTGGTLGDFTRNFSSSSVKGNIGIAVPEPGAQVMMLIGAAMLGMLHLMMRRASGRH